MYDIYSEKEQDPEKIINLCLKNNSHLHKSLFLKKISNHNFGFFLKEKIEKKIKVMGIPKKLFIPKEAFTNYLLGKKFDYVDKKFNETRDKAMLSMKSESLDFLFKNSFGFDTLTVNGCFEEEKKNGFVDATKTLAIENLNNLGIKIEFKTLFNFSVIKLFLTKLYRVAKKLDD